MNREEIRETVIRTLLEVAPEVDPSTLGDDDDLRDTLDLDSMDVLNLAVGLHQATGVDIPERDYAKLTTISACVDYVVRGTG